VRERLVVFCISLFRQTSLIKDVFKKILLLLSRAGQASLGSKLKSPNLVYFSPVSLKGQEGEK
jgi:hypothetical protein